MKRFIFLLLSAISFASCTTHYYVVRHADRLNNSDDSPISPDLGEARARALRDSLLSKGIDSIFASTYLRTQQTAGPLATALNETIRIYNPDTTAGLITQLKKINGKDILVVGHSDNVPAIVLGLSGQSVAPIVHSDFDNLYVIKVRKCFNTRRWLTQKTYGVPTL